ncbi:MAG TPA: lytic transglycosylase domain-containing protein [Homoserinimonas sp.]|nr:lytic transglycosylase domain-containing protein [Homoserinimonas sp.]
MANGVNEKRRMLVGGLCAAVVIGALVVVAIVALQPQAELTHAPAQSGPQLPPHAAPAPLPAVVDPAGTGLAARLDAQWLVQASAVTGIPPRALVAYVGAASIKADQMPTCGLSWNTIAGIGLVESDHGRHGGSRIQADGQVVPPIFGIALDGAATAHIPDSDAGTIDGDAEFDRAVGPLQLIPGTWRNWHVDGNGDGVEDPHNIDDAAVAATNYLCRASDDMLSGDGWRAGIAAYNRSTSYAIAVADAANRFAKATQNLG